MQYLAIIDVFRKKSFQESFKRTQKNCWKNIKEISGNKINIFNNLHNFLSGNAFLSEARIE